MRPNGTFVMYLAVLVVSAGVAALMSQPWFDPDADRLPIGLPITGASVALYSVYQLCRPAPNLVDDDSESNPREI